MTTGLATLNKYGQLTVLKDFFKKNRQVAGLRPHQGQVIFLTPFETALGTTIPWHREVVSVYLTSSLKSGPGGRGVGGSYIQWVGWIIDPGAVEVAICTGDGWRRRSTEGVTRSTHLL